MQRSRRTAEERTARETIQVVTFRLGTDEYGTGILDVHEITRPGRITTVPDAPPYVEGVMDLRDGMIPVVNLRKRLNLGQMPPDGQRRIIVVEVTGLRAGLMVDAVTGILRIPAGSITRPAGRAPFVKGAGEAEGRRVMLLDLPRLLSAVDTGGPDS